MDEKKNACAHFDVDVGLPMMVANVLCRVVVVDASARARKCRYQIPPLTFVHINKSMRG